jgi:uncharacterized protein YfkK (UPF0435 family)
MSFNLTDYYSGLTNTNVVLAFKGSITSDAINRMLENIEEKLDEVNEDIKVRKKVYNVLVECLQNLFHHVEDVPQDIPSDERSRFGILVVTKAEQGYRIVTANFIETVRIKPLKEKIDKINSLAQDELKDLYKFILNHQKLSAKGGGGLGLIDIARKTGNKIGYSFEEVNDKFYFFSLDIQVA